MQEVEGRRQMGVMGRRQRQTAREECVVWRAQVMEKRATRKERKRVQVLWWDLGVVAGIGGWVWEIIVAWCLLRTYWYD